MKRSGPPKRKTPLRSSRPQPAAGRWSRASRWEHDLLEEAVRRRSRGVCECCGRRDAAELHHRLMRSQGGGDLIENLAHVCGYCHHEAIHAHPDWSYRHGWLLKTHMGYPPPIVGCAPSCSVDHLD